MYKARVVTPWVSHVDDPSPQPSNHALLRDEYVLLSWTDVTGQPSENIAPQPNEATWEITCEDAVMTAIEADPTYEILWSEEITDAS